MARSISIGAQGFEDIRTNGDFYVDKTGFVRDWWQSRDQITLVCRPRRFGKTLNLDTVRCFFSTDFAGRGEELFGGLAVWDDPQMQELQGTVPVVSLSFARVKQMNFPDMLRRINALMCRELEAHPEILSWDGLTVRERTALDAVTPSMDAVTCADVPNLLCSLLRRYYGVSPVVLLDEYDAPMQQAWTHGFWDEASDFMRDLMNSTFKTNSDVQRGLITGVTRVSRESVFSDLNNLRVVTTSTPAYQTSFGFTEDEVLAALEEYDMLDREGIVRDWYDGFIFGGVPDIYNPWSITNYLADNGVPHAYWANTSDNGLVSAVIRRGDEGLKQDFEELLRGGSISKVIDEQIAFSELWTKPNAVWALLLAAGYLRSRGPLSDSPDETPQVLELTNREVRVTFDSMVEGWFSVAGARYDRFSDALLAGDAQTATRCLADVTRACISSFDGGVRPAESEPERFYHGLVLGMLAHLRGRYAVESNRESGYGRYDVMLVPVDGACGTDPAVVIEFKVFDREWDGEETLADTVARARRQIDEKAYVTALVERGIARERIRCYGVGFRGKEVLVG